MTRVLMVADGAWPTGFERVARGIGTYLQSTGRYEVIHRALGYAEGSKNKVAPYPYQLKPVRASSKDPMAVTQMPYWIKQDKPEVVLMIQDLWNQTNYLGYVPRELPTIGYYPVDTPNMKWSYALGAVGLTEAIPYTQFGAHETALGVRDGVEVILDAYAQQGASFEDSATWLTLPKDGMELHMRIDHLAERQNVEAYRPIPHGVDHAKFSPQDRTACRKLWGIPEGAFVVLNVNTNQFRKRQDITIRAFAKFLQSYPDAYLMLHCMGGNDKGGWDLGQLARLYGVHERVICTHWQFPELTDEQLMTLYNVADVQVNTGGGEGWGLTSVEGALCGVPQLVPDWSATREIWSGSGVLLPVSDYRFETKYLNTAHAILDADAVARAFLVLAQSPTDREAVGVLCRNRALSLPSWDDVGAEFAARIDACVYGTPDPVLPLHSVRTARRGRLESELLQRDR